MFNIMERLRKIFPKHSILISPMYSVFFCMGDYIREHYIELRVLIDSNQKLNVRVANIEQLDAFVRDLERKSTVQEMHKTQNQILMFSDVTKDWRPV